MTSRFGRLVLIARDGDSATVECSCGSRKVVNWWNLKSGKTTSCGCRRREVSASLLSKHGCSADPEFSVWMNMLGRCLNPKNPVYPLYGGRGITVCARWQTYENFLADMGRRPSANLSLDRIDNDGGYEPSNCRWADHRTQMNNTRCNVVIEHGGRKATVAEWAREIGINPHTLRNRLRRGMPVADALSRSVQPHAAAGSFDKRAYMRAYRERRKARVYGEPVSVPRETQSRLA